MGCFRWSRSCDFNIQVVQSFLFLDLVVKYLKMRYCPEGDDLFQIWQFNGLSRCFMETFPIALIFIVAFVFLISIILINMEIRKIRMSKIKKCGNYDRIDVACKEDTTELKETCKKKCQLKGFAFTSMPRPFFYVLQCLSHLILIMIPIANITGQIIICHKCITGSMIFRDTILLISWMKGFYCLQRERKIRYHRGTKRHSLLLILFVSITTLVELAAFLSWNSERWWFIDMSSPTQKLEFSLFCIRLVCNLTVFSLSMIAPGLKHQPEKPLKKSASQGSAFANFWEKTKKLYPFLWPKDRWLQLRVLTCFCMLVGNRVLNVYTPLQYKKIVNYLTNTEGKTEAPLTLIIVYIVFMVLKGGGGGSSGLLNNFRAFLWIKIQQYTSRSIQVQLFDHLHSLSLRWHLGRKTGEVLRMIDRGATSIDNLLNYILFSILPTIVDIIIGIVFFATAFNGWFALIVFCAMLLYIVASILITEWRTKFRREMNLLDNDVRAKAVDSLLNFETVKYYNNEEFEVDRYNKAIKIYQVSQWKAQASLTVLNMAQSCITNAGLLVGTIYCAHLVVKGPLKVGDFVLFITYMIQLYAPLNFFGTYYRMIQSAFIDMENMFDLMEEEVEIVDADEAVELRLVNGEIEFRDVSFYYNDSRMILDNISFRVRPGQTVALVGPSGGGKSTIIRLLFRFYECTAGKILIDGQNITTVTQQSLRACIGVVPQDTVLFNDTIRYNINYGNITANAKECEEAAKAADMHDKITLFKDEYETQVGERGLKLSGGEKQRVAIARTILKAPNIVVLDEATSALDTQTERNIQASLDAVSTGKTSVVIAHRLSTIIAADQILVLQNGSIVERGRHEELLSMEGVYANMWQQQLTSGSDVDTSEASSDGEK